MNHHHHHHLPLNPEGRSGTTDDFATSFLHFSLFSTALWDLANSRPVHSLKLSSHLFLTWSLHDEMQHKILLLRKWKSLSKRNLGFVSVSKFSVASERKRGWLHKTATSVLTRPCCTHRPWCPTRRLRAESPEEKRPKRPPVAVRKLWHLTSFSTASPANRHWCKLDCKMKIKINGAFKN